MPGGEGDKVRARMAAAEHGAVDRSGTSPGRSFRAPKASGRVLQALNVTVLAAALAVVAAAAPGALAELRESRAGSTPGDVRGVNGAETDRGDVIGAAREVEVSSASALTRAIADAQPGDTILMRSGTYRGQWYLTRSGRAEAPISLRSYPGEWAVLDAAGGSNPDDVEAVLEVDGAHWIVEHFEVMDGEADRSAPRAAGINLWGWNSSARHLVIHDTALAIGLWAPSGPNEVYGNVVFNNGVDNRDHSMYVTNNDANGVKTVEANILLNPSGHNVQAYHGEQPVGGLRIVANVLSGAGLTRKEPTSKDDLLFGVEPSNENRLRDVVLDRNYLFSPREHRGSVTTDYLGLGGHDGLTLINNRWWLGRSFEITGWTNVRSAGNTVADRSNGEQLSGTWTEPVDRYEPGRAHVIVMGGQDADGVERQVDLAGVLEPGQNYGIWDAFDIGRGPIMTGLYTGGPVDAPLDGSSRPRAPLGLSASPPEPEFGVFIVRATTRWSAP